MRHLWQLVALGGLLIVQGCAGLSSEPPLTLEDRMRAIGLLEQARVRMASGNRIIARGHLHEAIVLSTQGKWTDLIADGHFMLGELWEQEGNLNGAAEAYASAYAASRQINDRARGIRILSALGNLFVDLGAYDRALEASREVLKLTSDVQDSRSKSTAFNIMGDVHRFRGQYQAALEAYSRSLQLAREAGMKGEAAIVLKNMGYVSRRMGKLAEAQGLYREALALAREAGEEKTVLEALNHLAALLNERKLYAQALPLAKEAEEISRRGKYLRQLAEANHNLGVAQWQSGNREEGKQRLVEATRLGTQVNDRYLVALSKLALGTLALESGDRPTARVALEDSLRIFRELQLSVEASQADALLKGLR